MHHTGRRRQHGSVIITVCLVMLFLLGFMGIALDFGHLFVVKTELQTAMDSCALAAAQELDGESSALTRASSAGQTAGNLNNVNFQSSTWSDKGQLVDTDITFRDAAYNVTTVPANAKYAQCQHTQPAVQLWLLQAMGAFSGNTTLYPNTQNVMANAVAARAHAQSACPLPLALKPNPGGVAPDYGFTPGQWIVLLTAQGAATGGQIGWANLDGSNGAAETTAEMNGHCGTKIGDTLGTPGVQASVARAWNSRFGIYGGGSSPATSPPDWTGYAYTAKNWPSKSHAYDGPVPAASPNTATSANYITKRDAWASCANTGTSVSTCESITGLTLNSFSRLASSGVDGEHHLDGSYNRRIALVPIVNGAMGVIDYACMLILQPISIPMPASVQLEYIGNAAAIGSPCVTSGSPGGVAGPLVPVLVR
jgi:hypothetical protein